MRPAIKDERDYLADLRQIVGHCRAFGEQVIAAMRPRWPAVHDAVAPGIEELNSTAGHHLVMEVAGVAIKIAGNAAARSLATVDARLVAAVRASLGIDISPLLADGTPLAEAMRKKIAENVALIKSIPEQYLARVGEIVNQGFAEGMRWESLVAEIRNVGDVAHTRARIIARDQTAKLNSNFNEIRQTSVGIESYDWSGALDQRERPSHRAMEGQRIRWDQRPIVDGEAVHAGEAILCRCVGRPVINIASPIFAVAEAA